MHQISISIRIIKFVLDFHSIMTKFKDAKKFNNPFNQILLLKLRFKERKFLNRKVISFTKRRSYLFFSSSSNWISCWSSTRWYHLRRFREQFIQSLWNLNQIWMYAILMMGRLEIPPNLFWRILFYWETIKGNRPRNHFKYERNFLLLWSRWW